jgi:signal transduction histidine kinase
MGTKLNTLAGRMMLTLLLIQAVLSPALYLGVISVIKDNQHRTFIDDTRVYARVFADAIESDSASDSADIVAQLDSAILGGTAVYATLRIARDVLVSSLMDPAEVAEFKEDFAFGENGDNVYYLSLPVSMGPLFGGLRLGFDETPTLLQLAEISRLITYILIVYVGLSLILILVLAGQVVRPIHLLKQVSREIASGNYSKKIQAESNLVEINELTHDLETMRSKLVGVNARLQEVIEEREAGEKVQKSLEERLRHAHRLESIGTLAGGVAHEFNNVLAPIVLYTDLALEDLDTDHSAYSKMQRVMSLALRAKGLSQQILTFSSRTGDSERIAVDIAPFVEEGLSLVRALVPATVSIRAEVIHNLGLVLCDSTQVQQLVVNLCSNAFRALSDGQGEIFVSTERKTVTADLAARHPNLREGEYVTLAVRDNGAGMDTETMKRVFEPFFTTRETGQGTGLGLSVVHGIVVKHDGDIIVSSTRYKGSEFRVYLPLAGRQPVSNAQISG